MEIVAGDNETLLHHEHDLLNPTHPCQRQTRSEGLRLLRPVPELRAPPPSSPAARLAARRAAPLAARSHGLSRNPRTLYFDGLLAGKSAPCATTKTKG